MSKNLISLKDVFTKCVFMCMKNVCLRLLRNFNLSITYLLSNRKIKSIEIGFENHRELIKSIIFLAKLYHNSIKVEKTYEGFSKLYTICVIYV